MGLTHVIHPDLPPAPSTQQDETAFETIFKAKGWVAITDEQAAAHNAAIDAGDSSPVLAGFKPAKAGKNGEN